MSMTPQKPQLTDYERAFPPFFVQSHTSLAPFNRFSRDDEGLACVQSKIDESLHPNTEDDERSPGFKMQRWVQIAPYKRRRRCQPGPTVKDIIARMQGTSHNPMDLTVTEYGLRRPEELLKSVTMKSLKFAEDVRPPYVGTYSKLTDGKTITRVSRNPFGRDLPAADYDYDSEAEWEEPGEGEDLDSEGEEEIDEEDEDEMEGFLDDEEAGDARAVRRRPLLGDLEPTCTGICWAGESSAPDLSTYRIDTLTGKVVIIVRAHALLTFQRNPMFPNRSLHNSLLAPTKSDKDNSTLHTSGPGYLNGTTTTPTKSNNQLQYPSAIHSVSPKISAKSVRSKP